MWWRCQDFGLVGASATGQQLTTGGRGWGGWGGGGGGGVCDAPNVIIIR